MSGKKNVIGSCYVKVASSQLYLSNKIVVEKNYSFFFRLYYNYFLNYSKKKN